MSKESGIPTFLLKHQFRLLNPIKLLRASIEIYRFASREKFEVVHLTMPYSVIACFTLFFNRRIKKVWFQHGPVGGKLDFIASFFPVHAIIFNSSFTKDNHLSQTPCFTSKKEIIPLGVKIPSVNIALKNSAPELILVGRICEGKNQKEIISSFCRVMKNNPEWIKLGVRLKVIGSATIEKDKSYEKEIKDLINEGDCSSFVEIAGHHKDLEKIYSHSDILIHLPKNPEAFGLVIIEAMSYGVSVITEKKGGIQDILATNDLAYTITNHEDIEVTLTRVIKEHLDPAFKDKIEKMRTKAYERVSVNFSDRKMLEKIENLYLSLS